MHKQYFISDPHFGHRGILNFENDQGEKIRKFNTIDEMDATIITNVNKVVRPCDKLYILGDIAMNRRWVSNVGCLNGKKILIRGNHDIFQIKDYLPYFKDIRAYKVMPKHGIIFSHIPIFSGGLEGRFKLNVHGHLHANIVDDKRYMNICPEQIGYEPIELEEILERNNL